MSSGSSLKQIMEEQMREQLAEIEREKQVDVEKKKAEQIAKEKMRYITLRKLVTHETPIKLDWLEEDFYYLDRVIYSLLVPEKKTQTVRYADCGRFEKKEIPKLGIFDLVKVPYLYIKMSYMYTHYTLFGWIEDGLYKLLEFNQTACPSGGCDGESIHQLVGTTPEDVLGLLQFTKIYKDDVKRIVDAFEELPNKKRIVSRTKAVKEEMMMVYWHPDRYEKWAFDDDD